jgi:hypothetical protein
LNTVIDYFLERLTRIYQPIRGRWKIVFRLHFHGVGGCAIKIGCVSSTRNSAADRSFVSAKEQELRR